MIELLFRNISLDLGILKFKCSEISTKIMFIYMREIAQFKEGIRRLWKKLHQILLNKSGNRFAIPPSMLLKLLATIMPGLSNLSLI